MNESGGLYWQDSALERRLAHLLLMGPFTGGDSLEDGELGNGGWPKIATLAIGLTSRSATAPLPCTHGQIPSICLTSVTVALL